MAFFSRSSASVALRDALQFDFVWNNADGPSFVRPSSRYERDDQDIPWHSADHQPVSISFVACGVEAWIVHPDFGDIEGVHALVAEQVYELAIHLERVLLVEILDVEP